jgi:hypothetical protein
LYNAPKAGGDSLGNLIRLALWETQTKPCKNDKSNMKIISNQNLNDNRVISLFPQLQQTETSVNIRKKATSPNTDSENRLKAFYPVITNETFSYTMDNYRVFIATYNASVQEINNRTEVYNSTVAENLKSLTEVQKTYRGVFLKKHSRIVCEKEYNELVNTFNEQYGQIIALKRIPTVKYATELVFMQILHAYQMQLSKRATIFMKFDEAYKAPLPAVTIDSHELASFTRNGVQSINLTKRSLRNHRNRLQQAGVLVGYEFQGHKKGVKLHINDEIIAVFDLKTNILTTSENQQVIPKKGKKFPDNEEDTRTNKDKYKIKENVENNSQEKGTPSAVPFNLIFYGNTRCKQQNLTGAAAAENVKVSQKPKTLSEKLTQLIQHPQELAENLAKGLYNSYTPIDLRVLNKEAYVGTMTKEEFKELIIQDFIKTSAKIWKGKNVYIGVWKKTINEMYTNWFKAFTGQTFNKHIAVEMLQEYRWRINHARRWFVRHSFNALFPSDYFDNSRTERKEVGFMYTKKAWNKHLKYEQNKDLEKSKKTKKAVIRKQNLNAAKEIENKVRLYLKDKLELETLYNFVATNYPDYLDQLSQITYKIQTTLKP